MFDVWIGDVELTTLFLALCLSLILPGQLLLCLRVRSLALRLLPLCLLPRWRRALPRRRSRSRLRRVSAFQCSPSLPL